MIKTRNLILLAVVLAALLAINLAQKASHRSATGRASTAELLPAGLTADDLGRIVLGQGEGPASVELINDVDGWKVATSWDARADRSRIDALLRGLSGLRGEFRSEGGGVLADYGLDAASAIAIRGYDRSGGEAFALLAGDRAERAQGNFVRRADSDEVYLSEKGVLSLLGVYDKPEAPAGRFFLDLAVVSEDRLDIDRLVIDGGDGRLELAKEFAMSAPADGDSTAAPEPDRTTWEWRLAGRDDVILAKTKVDAVLNGAVNIRAVDLDDPAGDATAYGFDAGARKVTLVRADGSELVLTFGGEREAQDDRQGGTWMRKGDAPGVWVVTGYAVDNVFKPLSELTAD